MKITVEVQEGINLAPKYLFYKGEFANLTQCNECKGIGLYEDQHPVDPCPNCGGKVKPGLIGRWNYKKQMWEVRQNK